MVGESQKVHCSYIFPARVVVQLWFDVCFMIAEHPNSKHIKVWDLSWWQS